MAREATESTETIDIMCIERQKGEQHLTPLLTCTQGFLDACKEMCLSLHLAHGGFILAHGGFILAHGSFIVVIGPRSETKMVQY